MKKFGLLLILICVTLRTITTTATDISHCGSTFLADNGTIQYKPEVNYNEQELCVFIIRYASGFGKYTYNLDSDGISESDADAITILGIYVGFNEHSQYHLGYYNKNVTIGDGYGAMVIFRTNISTGTGFKLSFKVEATDGDGARLGRDVVVNNATTIEFPIPETVPGVAYNNYFVFTNASSYTLDPKFTLSVLGYFGNAGSSCDSRFVVYSFETSLKQELRLCEQFYDGSLWEFQTRGLLIVWHYQADFTAETEGKLAWKPHLI